MNKIIQNLVTNFKQVQCSEIDITETQAFEYFSAYLAIGSLTENTSDTNQTVVGHDNQPSVDAIGIIVNGNLISNIDEIDHAIDFNKYLEVDFVFVQAKTSENFDSTVLADLGNFAFDFIVEDSCVTDTKAVIKIRKIKNKIFNESRHFKRSNPNVHLYYVTTGNAPINDINFKKKNDKIHESFEDKGLTNKCIVNLIGNKEIQALNRSLDNSIEKEIEFNRRIPLPQTAGIDEAYLGVVSAPTFISLLSGPSDNLLSTIFYDNVRDWQGLNSVNSGIADTLKSAESKSRFVLMNNGITVIAKKIRPTGEKIVLEDYQIVNGCQTSNVLWNNKEILDDKILIPIKIISTTNEKVIIDIIRATNSQTAISATELLAATEFQKQLEQFFDAQNSLKLHYERRSKQFSSSTFDRTKILTPISLMKAYASIVLDEPHKTMRGFKSIYDKVGKSIFATTQKLELYYMAAVAQYWIDYFLRKGIIDNKLTGARFQILLAFKLLNQSEGMPAVSSNKASKWAIDLTDKLNTAKNAYANFKNAIELVSDLLDSKNNKKDAVRSSSFTDDVIKKAKQINLTKKTKILKAKAVKSPSKKSSLKKTNLNNQTTWPM